MTSFLKARPLVDTLVDSGGVRRGGLPPGVRGASPKSVMRATVRIVKKAFDPLTPQRSPFIGMNRGMLINAVRSNLRGNGRQQAPRTQRRAQHRCDDCANQLQRCGPCLVGRFVESHRECAACHKPIVADDLLAKIKTGAAAQRTKAAKSALPLYHEVKVRASVWRYKRCTHCAVGSIHRDKNACDNVIGSVAHRIKHKNQRPRALQYKKARKAPT